MIFDSIPYLLRPHQDTDPRSPALNAFVSYIERKLGVKTILEPSTLPWGNPEFAGAKALADTLLSHGVITGIGRSVNFVDEPPYKIWGATCNNGPKHPTGGSHFTNETQAIYAALAEALERYLWTEADDHLQPIHKATEAEIAKIGAFTPIASYAGFSAEDRAKNPRLTITPETQIEWVRAHSLVTDTKVYVPMQAVSGNRKFYAKENTEPLVRIPITTGAAVWSNKDGALIRGIYEIIERDAYMIWWLNQLVLPRISIEDAARSHAPLAYAVETCARYRIKLHAIQLITDAPAHVVCTVAEDTSGVSPRYTFGLKAGQHIPSLVEAASIEALRARRAIRHHHKYEEPFDTKKPVNQIGHRERSYYWAVPENANKLSFLLEGKVTPPAQKPWDTDSPKEHVRRVAAWCKEIGYEMAHVSPGTSTRNPTNLHMECVTIPQMQPTYLTEDLRQASGPRLARVPKAFGYAPRSKPFLDAPHPFS